MEIFADTTDLTKWLIAIFMACIALFIATMTHKLARKRAKTEFMRVKLDEIRILFIKYNKLANGFLEIPSVVANRPNLSKEDLSTWRAYDEILKELNSSITNYAPYLKKNLDAIHEITCRATVKNKEDNPPDGVDENYSGYKKYLETNADKFDELLKEKIKENA